MTLRAFAVLVLLALMSYGVAAIIGFLVLWPLRDQPLIRRVAVLLCAIAFWLAARLVAISFGYIVRPVYTAGFAWSYAIGEAVLCAAVFSLVLFVSRLRK